jgi:predicted nucleic acid-binding protein
MAGEPYLTDTNVLLRLTRRDDPDYAIVRAAVQALRQRDSVLCYAPQNLVEYWNVVTQPKDRNGFGLSVVEANREAKLIEGELTLLPDNDQIHRKWRELVVVHSVSGVQVHDARLAAAMQTHGITHLLTLNVQDFVRYSGIKVVHPRDLSQT